MEPAIDPPSAGLATEAAAGSSVMAVVPAAQPARSSPCGILPADGPSANVRLALSYSMDVVAAAQPTRCISPPDSAVDRVMADLGRLAREQEALGELEPDPLLDEALLKDLELILVL